MFKIAKQSFFIRNLEGEAFLEAFLVSAVTSVLGIRGFLYLSGYPRIEFGSFHIAHLLWGGLLMTIALLMLMSFLNRRSYWIAAVIGGLGFGAFIDELGKFITHDNNYFYQPTFALIYVIFILIYLFIQYFDRLYITTQKEYLINTLEVIKESIINDLDKDDKRQALIYLRRVSTTNPYRHLLAEMLEKVDVINVEDRSAFGEIKDRVSHWYNFLISQTWFNYSIIFFFLIKSIFAIFSTTEYINDISEVVIAVVLGLVFMMAIYQAKFMKISPKPILIVLTVSTIGLFIYLRYVIFSGDSPVVFANLGQIISSTLAGLVAIGGVIAIGRSRLQAYQLFKYSVLVSIFLTQFFTFYLDYYYGLVTLVANVIVLVTLRYMINQELNQIDPD